MTLQDYFVHGWSVFPVKGGHGVDYADSKTPLVPWEEYQKRKPTEQEISLWMKKYPKMSVGAVTGPINGFLVVDIDGNDWVKAFPNADFGMTWQARSKRGCHYFYKWESWMEGITSTQSSVGGVKGFDIRGKGGYVVVPNVNEPARSWTIAPWK